ncbi:Spore cortex-lytic enzyme [Bacillus sp. FJAT-27916]|uniref:spore cortex-lytic enzyme n=1 Tax=Bacillaceae TaxID=186817 RepID=UPI0006717617|nr:spore cortex-lytic enzyme [Bacillus sp. FJAT-27916]KMY44153.1 Spore cortex-lytic enzyme [Bacillus sp. FJAT-27916]
MKGLARKSFSCLLIGVILTLLPIYNQDVSAFSNQVIQKGATGDDVVELQARLQNIGYYHGQIDGVFGWGTYWALRNFQESYGLPIDGLAGSATKQKLSNVSNFNKTWVHQQINSGNTFTYYQGMPLEHQVKKSTSGTTSATNKPATNKNTTAGTATTTSTSGTAANIPSGFSESDINLMANAVYGESRGEPYEGQVAVAAVILNRVQSASFPNTVSGVIFQPGAFTAVSDGQIWLTPNEQAKQAVMDAMNGWDPTGEAEYYFNPETATSAWIWTRPQIKQIGKHIFCR